MKDIKQTFADLDPSARAFSLLDEFKRFAFKGNVVDLAVGVIIGTAFGKVVSSLVENIFMPAISLLTPGEQGYTDWALHVGAKPIKYGLFLGDVVNFLLVALAVFLFIVKFLGWIMKSKKQEAVTPPPPTTDQQLLTEIRDLLAARSN